MEGNKLKKWLVVISTILLISIMGITMGGREKISVLEDVVGKVITPIQKGFYAIGNTLSQRIEPIINVWEIKSINESLVKENAELKEDLINNTLSQLELKELKELKKALRYISDSKMDSYVTCNVIAKDQGNWYNMFTIDQGSSSGITKNSAVLNGSGLVGQVYEVGENWSKVVSIIDNNASIGFQILDYDNKYFGQLVGSSDHKILGYFFDPQALVEKGELLMTSGLGVYPKGILIGRVGLVNKDVNNLLVEIEVEPFVDFRKIDKVVVIPYEKLD